MEHPTVSLAIVEKGERQSSERPTRLRQRSRLKGVLSFVDLTKRSKSDERESPENLGVIAVRSVAPLGGICESGA